MCATSAMETKVRTGHSSMGDSNTVVSAYAVLLSPIDTSLNKITMDDFKTALSLSLSLWEGGKQKEKSGMGLCSEEKMNIHFVEPMILSTRIIPCGGFFFFSAVQQESTCTQVTQV